MNWAGASVLEEVVEDLDDFAEVKLDDCLGR